ncbi:MAG: hypothetical protein EPO68_00205, partial [Planctomycetota bacterium]
MSKPLPWIAFGILLALLCGVAGAVASQWLASPRIGAEGAQPRAAGADPALAAALAELAREVGALRIDMKNGALSGADGSPGVRASTDAPTPLSADKLEALLLRVANALERSSGVASAQSFEAELALRPTGATAPGTLAALQVATAYDYDRLLLEHKFWSYQRLLQRYGTPDRITADGPTCTF